MTAFSMATDKTRCTKKMNIKLIHVKISFIRDDEVLINKEGGYLVRTKTPEHSDGGICAGRAVYDSAYMV